ncbi:MAG: DUF2304 family protein [Candidatus Tectomicrobia bacterium]|uniref:DUF2304 family protein n=1 Tax=Tectimicrobiota bacterium TaxID=2528274 RepID=A0A932I221_UNCTE|nr:DUF2304 family protein [Candidatus Tectomicrobia bacterium]
MSGAFLFFANLVGLLLAAYALRLVIRVRLYVGYAVAWLILIAAGLLALDLPVFWPLLRRMAGTPDTQQAWMLMVLAGVVFILVYFSVQLTILSKRISDIARHLALRETPPPRPGDGAEERHE